MRPAAEQVVRDYLNRVSVVARGRLRPEEWRLFLPRVRDYIERQSGIRGMTDPADVMRALNDYGEPEALVERERARLEARHAERERAAAASQAAFGEPKPRAGPLGRARKSGKGGGSGTGPPSQNLTIKDGRPVTGENKAPTRPSSSRWRPGTPFKPSKTRRGRVPPPPPAPPRDAPPEGNGAAAPGTAGPGGTGPESTGSGSARPGSTTPGSTRPGSTRPGSTRPGSTRPGSAGPGGAGPGSGSPAGAGSAGSVPDGPPAAPPQVVLNGVEVGSGAGTTGNGAASGSGATAAADDGAPVAGTPPPAPTRRGRRSGGSRRLQPGDGTRAREIARRAADAGRQHRAEAIAVVLLALGGLIVPIPIWLVGFLLWLIGALIAVFSEVWSRPDKWLGVIGPLALVVFGTATIVSLGGTQSNGSGYVHEVLTAAMYLFKIGAVLGAGYLAWQLQRGRRSPQIPPWRHI
jgi:hypothetical protein